MSKKSVVAKIIIALFVVSAMLFFYSDYMLGILTARPDFQLSASPTLIRLGYMGSSNATIIVVKSVNGLDSNVELNVKPVFGVLGVKFTLDPSEFHLKANEEVACMLKIEVTSNMMPGQYIIDVSGISGNLTRTIRITVEIFY